VGTFLIPRLVEAGYEVVNVSRGRREPYRPHAAWKQVQHLQADRGAEEASGVFTRKIADLEADVLIDMICFTEASARAPTGRGISDG
jgi:hypothetical protein